jgi:hypothetical protein
MKRSKKVVLTSLAAAAAVVLSACDDDSGKAQGQAPDGPVAYTSQQDCRASSGNDECPGVAVEVDGGPTHVVWVPSYVHGSFYYPYGSNWVLSTAPSFETTTVIRTTDYGTLGRASGAVVAAPRASAPIVSGAHAGESVGSFGGHASVGEAGGHAGGFGASAAAHGSAGG